MTRTDVEHKPVSSTLRLVTLGSTQLAGVAAGVVLVIVVVAILVYPELYIQYIQRFGIRPFETQYGFRTGEVPVSSSVGKIEPQWGIVWVAPNGRFAHLGVRSGDIPFEYHGGVTDMYGALQRSSSGELSSFNVYNAADAHLGRSALRQINLPPSKGQHQSKPQ